MKRLYQDFELIDDPDSCNCELFELFTIRQIRDLSIMVNGNDWHSVMQDIGSLILVGENRKGDNCPNCGYPEYYYTGGRMLCNQCEHSEPAASETVIGDIGSYEGRITL